MRGISDLDSVCLTEIFKNLAPLDLCSMRQCSKRFRHFVDDHLHSLYFVRDQWLDLENENIRNVDRILKNFGKFVCYLKVRSKAEEPNLMLDVIATSCGDILRGLSLTHLCFYEFDMQKFAGVSDNLKVLKIIRCSGDQKCYESFLLGHEYPNLLTLKIEFSAVKRNEEVHTKFFMKKRSLKKLDCWMPNNVVPLIVLHAAEIEDLRITIFSARDAISIVEGRNPRNVMPVAQLKNLKRLDIYDGLAAVALIKKLSVNNELEMIGLSGILFNEEYCDVISKLTNVKDLRLKSITINDSTSIQMLCQKLSKLESLMVADCAHVPYQNILASVRISDKFRTIYIMAKHDWRIASFRNFIEQMLKGFLDGSRHSCFVAGNPLYIYLSKDTFAIMKGLFTEENLMSIKKYGNIKIHQVNDAVFGRHRYMC